MTTVLVVLDGGLVQEIVSDQPLPEDIDIRIIDRDRETEERQWTAEFLWENRDVLRRTGPRISRHTSPGEARGAYDIDRRRFIYGAG